MSEEVKRVYVDNSVVSGIFDDHMPERVEQTAQFWQAVIDSKIKIIVSDVLEGENRRSPQNIRDFYDGLPKSQIVQIESTDESNRLASEYIGARVITEKHMNDCRHVAIATVASADAVVSWNCDDLVNPNRIPKYNEVNKKLGYQAIKIVTPYEFLNPNNTTEVFYDNT